MNYITQRRKISDVKLSKAELPTVVWQYGGLNLKCTVNQNQFNQAFNPPHRQAVNVAVLVSS
jgi:hypothetical protein